MTSSGGHITWTDLLISDLWTGCLLMTCWVGTISLTYHLTICYKHKGGLQYMVDCQKACTLTIKYKYSVTDHGGTIQSSICALFHMNKKTKND